MTAAMNIKEKFDQYEYTIRLLTAKLQELADENARLTSELGAHDVLRRIYLDEAQPSGTRVKAAQAALNVEKPRLMSVPQPLNLVTDEVVVPLAELVEQRRARQNSLESADQAPNLLPVASSCGNGGDSQD